MKLPCGICILYLPGNKKLCLNKECCRSQSPTAVGLCFQQRPEFREIIPILEECRQSQAVAMLSNVDPPPSLFPSALPMVTQQEVDPEGRSTPPLVGHVSALRNHWEMEASRNRWEEGSGLTPLTADGLSDVGGVSTSVHG